MIVTIVSLRLMGLIAGTGLYGFALLLFWSKRGKTRQDWVTMSIAAAMTGWHLVNSLILFRYVLASNEDVPDDPGLALVWLSLLPAIVFEWSVYRRHTFGLFIRRRLIIAFEMSLTTAAYLLLVRNVARYAEAAIDVYGRLLELALILAAGVLWLPLYSWLARRQARRLEAHTAFAKRLMEEAAAELDLESRMQLIATRVSAAFGFARVLLVSGELQVPAGVMPPAADPGENDFLFLPAAEYKYIFPLRDEHRVIGTLYVDPSPRVFLDEDEAAMVVIARQIAHSLEACRRIDEKFRTEMQLVRQEHLAMVGTLAASIAHEVKNPLSAIKTLSQVMAETPDLDPRLQQDLGFMGTEIDRLSACVQQLLTYAKPVDQHESRITVGELLHTTARLLSHDFAERNLRIECGVEPAAENRRVPYQAMQQVLLNLGLNAAQASEAGGRVSLDATQLADGRIAIAVGDQGPGIAASEREKIFEPFFSTKPKGTGLGLAIVRKNLRYLNGEISLTSPAESGRGAKFTVVVAAT